MSIEFKFPDVGEGITEGEIVRWLVKEGDTVKEHQPLAEVETDKAVVELPSPSAGKILKINHQAGETAKVGEVLVIIGDGGEKVEAVKETRKEKSVSVVGQLEESEEVLPSPTVAKKSLPGKEIIAVPAVRKLAKELDLDLSKVSGTGRGGMITEKDVMRADKHRERVKTLGGSVGVKITKKYDLYGYIDRLPLKGVRKATAKKMVEAVQHVPHVTHMDEADVTELANLRNREKVKAKEKGIKLTYLSYIVKAVITGLKEFPNLNSTVDEERGEIIVKKYYNLSIAVAVDEGLIVPVIKGADQKGVYQIAKEIQTLAEKARTRKIDLQDLKGGTFTITNVGSVGGIYFTPIVNYPESAILATGIIYDKPIVVNGKIEIRKVLPLSLSFDHRVVDGAYAAGFLNSVILHLQDPQKLK